MPAGRLARQNAGGNARVDDTSAGGNARLNDPASRDAQLRTTDSMSQSSIRPNRPTANCRLAPHSRQRVNTSRLRVKCACRKPAM